MNKLAIRRLAIAAAALCPAWGAALAQDSDDLRVRVGLGAQLRPEFIGSDDHELGPLFDLDFARGSNEFKFEAPDYRFGIPILSSSGFALGPAAAFASSRKESDVGAPVGKVKSTFELGGFASYAVSENIHLRAEIVKGLGGHEGVVGQIGADGVWRDGDRYVVSVGPRLLFSNARYQRAYFEVTPAAALATGLPEYRPNGGIHGVAVASGLSTQFTPRIGLFGYARYERLVGDAADSPIVRELGSRNQLSGGVGLNYTFTINR